MPKPLALNDRRLSAVLLAVVLCLALALRLKGMWFGYPLMLHPDEPAIVDNALRMVQTGDLNPHFFNYPSLNIYLQALVSRLTMLGSTLLGQSAAEIPPIRYTMAGRLFVVLQSVLTIAVTFEIGRRLFSALVGLLAAVFMAFAFLHVANSFIVTVDAPSALWATLATLAATLVFTGGKRLRYYVLGGLFAGLAAGSKYTAVVSIAPLVVAHVAQSRADRRWIDRHIVAAVAVAALTFLLTTPYALLDFATFAAAIRFEAQHYRTGHTGAESSGRTSFLNYAGYLATTGYGPLALLLAVLGAVWLTIKDPARVVLLLATPLLLFLFVGQYKVFFPRNVVILIPYLALLSGYFVAAAFAWLRARVPAGASAALAWGGLALLLIITAAAVYPQAAESVAYVRRITLPDTRWTSIAWLESNIPAGSTIGREHYTPPLENYSDDFPVTYLGYGAVAARPDEVETFDYMIVSEGDYGRYFNAPQTYPAEVAAYDTFFQRHELVHEFVADGTTLTGPTIRVYRISPLAGDG